MILKWLGREDAPFLLRLRAVPGLLAWGLRFLRQCNERDWRRNTRTVLRLCTFSHERLRLLVRERLQAGDSDQQVLDHLVDRYGEFVLLRPRMRPGTYLLWFGPVVLFLLGAAGVWFYFRRQRGAPATAAAPLSDDEQRRLARLLDDDEPGDAAPGAQRRHKKRS